MNAKHLRLTDRIENFGKQGRRHVIYVNYYPALVTESFFLILKRLADGPANAKELDADPENIHRNLWRWKLELGRTDVRLRKLVKDGLVLLKSERRADHEEIWSLPPKIKIEWETDHVGGVPNQPKLTETARQGALGKKSSR